LLSAGDIQANKRKGFFSKRREKIRENVSGEHTFQAYIYEAEDYFFFSLLHSPPSIQSADSFSGSRIIFSLVDLKVLSPHAE